MGKAPEMPEGFNEMVYSAWNPYTKTHLGVYKRKKEYLVREHLEGKLVHEYLTDKEGATEEVEYIKSDTGGKWRTSCDGLVRK